jgi:hypothetical protein
MMVLQPKSEASARLGRVPRNGHGRIPRRTAPRPGTQLVCRRSVRSTGRRHVWLEAQGTVVDREEEQGPYQAMIRI